MSKVIIRFRPAENKTLISAQPNKAPELPKQIKEPHNEPQKVIIKVRSKTTHNDIIPVVSNDINPNVGNIINPNVGNIINSNVDNIINSDVNNDINTETHTKVKLIVTKKISDSKSYTITGTVRKTIPVPHEPIDLPEKMELDSFLYQNDLYWIEKKTGYIFLPDDIQNDKLEPVGRFIVKPPAKEMRTNFCPLPNRRINWYLKYEFDVIG